ARARRAATPPAPVPGCGRARRFPGGAARRSRPRGAARPGGVEVGRAARGEAPTHRPLLGAVEVGRAGRGEIPTRRRTAVHRGTWPRWAGRSPHPTGGRTG